MHNSHLKSNRLLTRIPKGLGILVLLQFSIALAGNPRPFVMRKTFFNGDDAKTDRGLCTSGGTILLPAKFRFLVSERPGLWWAGTSVSDDECEGKTGQLINDQGEPLTPAMFSDYVDGLFGPDVIWGAYGAIFVTGNENGRHLNYVVFQDGTTHCLGRFRPQRTDLRFVSSERPDGSATLYDLKSRTIREKLHYDDISVKSDSIAIAGKGGKFGIISTDGTTLLDLAHDRIEIFDDMETAHVVSGKADGLYSIGSGWAMEPDKDVRLCVLGANQGYGKTHFGKMIGVSRKGKYGVFNLATKEMIVPATYDGILELTPSVARMLRIGETCVAPLVSLQSGKELTTSWLGEKFCESSDGIGTIWRVIDSSPHRSFCNLCVNDKLMKFEGVDFALFLNLGNPKRRCAVLLQNNANKTSGVWSLDGARYLVPMQGGIEISIWRDHVLITKTDTNSKCSHLSIVDHGGNTLLDYEKKATFLDWQIDIGGYSKIVCDGKAGLVDGDCNFVLPCQYEDVGHFGEELVPAKQGGMWGFVTLDGKWAIPARFKEARAFKGGYAPVCVNGKWGFIDKAGKAATPFEYEDVKDVREGHFRAKEKGKWGIFALDGTCTLPAEYDAILAEGEPGYGEM